MSSPTRIIKPPFRLKRGSAKLRRLYKDVFERDRFCQFCGTPNHLTPAHIIRKSQGGEDTLENIMAACVQTEDGGKGCHTRFDQYEIELPERVMNRLSEDFKQEYFKTRRTADGNSSM